MPGQDTAAFSLTTTFAPQKRETLAAFMAANAEPGPDYGTIRLLRLPRNTTIPGPTQVQNNFESDPVVARDLSLFRSQGSDVELGNLLTLPVGGGLLYVEPLYIRAQGAESYPLLRKVLVAFGNRVGYADTLEESLLQVFGRPSRATRPTATAERMGSAKAPPPRSSPLHLPTRKPRSRRRTRRSLTATSPPTGKLRRIWRTRSNGR